MNDEKQIRIPEHRPMSTGVRLDNRTIVFPKNPETTKETLQSKYGNRMDKIKESTKQYALK